MNKYDLNTEELINLLLDKDTSESDKTSILEQLNNNPENQSLLQDYKNLQSMIDKATPPLVSPPVEWTNAVLDEVKTISEQHFALQMLQKAKYALLGLLFLLPIGIYFALFNQNNQAESIGSAKSITQNIDVKENNSNFDNNNKETPLLTNFDSKKTKSESTKSKRNKVISKTNKNSTVNNSTELSQNTATKPNEIEEKNIIESIDNQFIERIEEQQIIAQNVEPKIVSQPNINSIANNENDESKKLTTLPKLNIILQSRGIYALTNPEKNYPENDFIGKTYNLGVFFEVYDNSFAGAEFGSEVFSQIFFDQTIDGLPYDQQPTLFYFGLSGKYEFNQLSFGIIKPVGHLFVGGSSLGPLVRSNIVLQANIISNLGVFAGVEGGLLYYKNQNVWYNSGKLSAIGGINIRF